MRLTNKDLPFFKQELLKAQKYECPLCHAELDPDDTKNLCLDHDHTTGHVRAVLCRNCNGIEGRIYNLVRRAKRLLSVLQWIANLLKYWEYHAKNPSGVWYPTFKTEDEKRVLRNKRARLKRKRNK